MLLSYLVRKPDDRVDLSTIRSLLDLPDLTQPIRTSHQNRRLALHNSVQDRLLRQGGIQRDHSEVILGAGEECHHPLETCFAEDDDVLGGAAAGSEHFGQCAAEGVGLGIHLGVGLPAVAAHHVFHEHLPIRLHLGQNHD